MIKLEVRIIRLELIQILFLSDVKKDTQSKETID